ncbi:nucleoside hydrolase [Halalkalibacter krulwichiae]|uniref:Pyrimidine-specific ribonucleoside hydrolase RihB n=1 Tax=Halalkalibacter krulwichiae TaxID=199441 RepID=A0A1X9MFK2_9BACI|nr:nucleoside hydrolase [Halalkalibacter krulwichiae]ARK32235.1 Pyrimidine-specific ribonucleoside hydrolase RihB [Halalkalibacter krulwichiae]
MTNRKLILDVDTGVDDALGIILAVKSRQFDILGITTTNGNVSLETATTNTCKILELLQVDREIPVIKGADQPLKREAFFEHRIHGNDGLGGALLNMKVTKEVTEGFAPDFIIEQVQAYPNEVTLVMTGPLTNLALAIERYPKLVNEVKEVIFMGGVVKGVGNVTPTAEYNMYVDPEAAKAVMKAGIPRLTLVGLDVTRKALLNAAHVDRILDPKLREYVQASTADYTKRYFERNGVMACALHDPLAVGVALNKQIVETNAYYVDVEANSELCDGQTVCDFQNRLQKKANVQVCVDVDSEAFLNLFIETLNA